MNNHNPKIIKHKIGLLNLATELGNVSKTCKMMGVSRDTFYRYKQANDECGVDALFEKYRRKPNLKNRIDIETEKTVMAYAIELPAHGQLRTSNELRKQGVFISSSGFGCIWPRHGLHNFKLRLKALEAKAAKEGLVLTEAQV
jgi:transposase